MEFEMTSGQIEKMFGFPRGSVDATLAKAKHGLLLNKVVKHAATITKKKRDGSTMLDPETGKPVTYQQREMRSVDAALGKSSVNIGSSLTRQILLAVTFAHDEYMERTGAALRWQAAQAAELKAAQEAAAKEAKPDAAKPVASDF